MTVFKWFPILGKFISFQLVIQAINLASGILIVRTLSKEEYAYFTLANAMQVTISTLADSGIGSALYSIGGKVWQDPFRFGQLINTAMWLRRYLGLIATLVITPILFWMLIQNGASIGYTLLLIFAILVELYFYLNIGVLLIIPRLRSQVGQLQNLELVSAASRLILVGGGTLTFFNAAVAAFASTIASGLQNSMLWSSTKKTIDVNAPINEEDRVEIQRLVKAQAFNTIFYCLQGQIAIWLISIFGNTQNIAEIAALGRLSVVFSLIGSILTNIVLPSFARCQSRKKLILKYWQIIGFYLIFCSLILFSSFLFNEEFLWILGDKYSHLRKELVFVVLAAITQSITGVLWSINSVKGWLDLAWLFPPTIILTQVFLLLLLDVSNIIGVTLFGMFSVIPASCINFYMTYKGISKVREF